MSDEPKQEATTSTEPEKQTNSMFDMADKTSPVPKADNPTEADAPKTEPGLDATPEWDWGEGLKGEGTRPDWLKERYKSVSDQAQAYTELEKKFGEFKGAPKEEYSFENIEGINKDDPMLAGFSETFKEMNLSQSGFEKLTSKFIEMQKQSADIDIKAEMAKLGPTGPSIIKQTHQRIMNNLPAESVEIVQSWIQTADDINVLNAIFANQPLSAIPNNADRQQGFRHETSKEVANDKVKRWKEIQEDPNLRSQFSERMQRAQTREANAR